MIFSSSLIDGEHRFKVEDSTGNYIGHALAALSQNGRYWDFKEIRIDDDRREKKYGTKLLNYARSYLWNLQELPILAHVGIDPVDAIRYQLNPLSNQLNQLDINKKFYRKCGFQEEFGEKHFVCFPPNYQP